MNTTKRYTPAMLRRFDLLTERMSSPNQMVRITARLDTEAFQKKHGKEICDEMFTVLRKRDRKRGAR